MSAAHWAGQYIGQPWSEGRDCFGWFQFWTREHFGRDVPTAGVDHSRLLQSAARTMQGDVEAGFGYRQTDCPREGDAVFLGQKLRPHHLGMVIYPYGGTGPLYVLHAVERTGVMCSSLQHLTAHGWKIRGFWTYAAD